MNQSGQSELAKLQLVNKHKKYMHISDLYLQQNMAKLLQIKFPSYTVAVWKQQMLKNYSLNQMWMEDWLEEHP